MFQASNANGRPNHLGWFGYRRLYINKKAHAKCMNCLRTFANTAKSRLDKHRTSCGTSNIAANQIELGNDKTDDEIDVDKDSPTDIQIQSFFDDIDDSGLKSRSNVRPKSSSSFTLDSREATPVHSPTSEFRSATPVPTSTPKQAKLKRFLDLVKPSESDNLDIILAEFFYGCNIPFAIVESKYFKKMIKALRPAYNPPNRRNLAGNLLDKVHEKIEKANFELVRKMDKEMTLLVDGWQNSSSNRHNVVTMLATANDQKVFLESFDFSSIRETGANLLEIVEQSLNIAKDRYDATVTSVLTDNAFNMSNMGNSAQRSLNVLYSTCNAHSANLLAGDIIKEPQNAKTMAKVMIVQKEFKKTGLEDRLLKAGGRKPILSCATRWTSQRDAANSLLRNLKAMKKVAAGCDEEADVGENATKPKSYVSQLLYDVGFQTSVTKLLEILNPVAELTNFCQKSSSSAADAAEKWLTLFSDCPELFDLLENRCKRSNVFNTVTMTANYLHPAYRGQKLSPEQQQVVKDYIFDQLESNGLESCRLFTQNEGTFEALQQKEITNTKTFWHYAAEQNHQDLSKFAIKFLKIPASTAQLERLFSHWGYVHNDIRNRLSVETSKKLVNIYFTLRSADVIPDDDDKW